MGEEELLLDSVTTQSAAGRDINVSPLLQLQAGLSIWARGRGVGGHEGRSWLSDKGGCN